MFEGMRGKKDVKYSSYDSTESSGGRMHRSDRDCGLPSSDVLCRVPGNAFFRIAGT